jgi:hypothetical protein
MVTCVLAFVYLADLSIHSVWYLTKYAKTNSCVKGQHINADRGREFIVPIFYTRIRMHMKLK